MSELDGYSEKEKQEAIQSILWRREYDRQRYQEHRDERLEHIYQYYRENRDAILECMRRYYQKYRDKLISYQHLYRREHPEVHKASRHKRRAAIADSNSHFTAEEFKLLCEAFENRCFYCKQELPLTPDHAVPLSRGGSNSIENIIPACMSCNNRKKAKTLEEFLEEGQ